VAPLAPNFVEGPPILARANGEADAFGQVALGGRR
jgi:hypothetical protein